jgi:hypothetical protein
MHAKREVFVGALAIVVAAMGPGSHTWSKATDALDATGGAPVQLADMGMGELGADLGGSQNDMVLTDPGRLPREPDMVVSDPGHEPAEAGMDLSDPGHEPAEAGMVVGDPGHVPSEAGMDIQQPQDLDLDDDID